MSTYFTATMNTLLAESLKQGETNTLLQRVLDAALCVSGGKRAFLAQIMPETGELRVRTVAGRGWNERKCQERLKQHHQTQQGITTLVATTGEPYIATDLNTDPHTIRLFDDVRSEIAVAVFDTEGRVNGVLNVQGEKPNAFHNEILENLRLLAGIVAVAWATEAYREREQMLAKIGRELAFAPDKTTLAQRVVEGVVQALRCEACSLFFMETDEQTLTLAASHSALSSQVGRLHYRVGEGLTGTVAQTRAPIRLEDPRSDPRWLGRHPEFHPDEGGAFLAVPIVRRERVLGVLRVSRPKKAPSWFHGHFTQSDEQALLAIGAQVGAALENIEVFQKILRSERMAAWGELSAKSAHMIGNRVFAIKGDLNELKYVLKTHTVEASWGSEAHQLLDSMEQGIYRLEHILREFRDFVVATQLHLVECNLNQVVQESLNETFPKLSPVHLRICFDPQVSTLRCDPEKLKRAFSELIENALSFQPEGGVLEVTTQFIGEQDMAKTSPPQVQITFRDEGPGVPEEEKERIFTPFYTSRVKGMGLGLSIVKGIIEAHQGSIREIGRPGEGATFCICLPTS